MIRFMIRNAFALLAAALLSAASSAAAQDVAVAQLAAPDAFTTAGRQTGLPSTLWAGASAQTARIVLPLLATRPLSPAASALARRVLATGAPGPEGAAQDPDLAAARANALMVQGDPRAAAAILANAPALDRNADLARAAAEAALLTGDEARACQVAQGLSVGREETYWLKLRTYCQAIAGQTAQAQLTFELVQAQVKDPIFARLMGAKLAGAGNPGAASARNGLDYALSHSLGLDLSAAKASPAVAAAVAGLEPGEPKFDALLASPEYGQLAGQIESGKPLTSGTYMDAMLATTGDGAKGAASARAQTAAFLAVSLETKASRGDLEFLKASTLPEGKAPLGRNLALEAAAGGRLMGEAALLALWTCVEAGPSGPSPGDRVRIVRALRAVGLDRDARTFVLEGLAGLK